MGVASEASGRLRAVKTRQAELISTGAELLSGRSLNTHARLLGERLGRLGIALTRDTTVPDDIGAIQQAVQDAMGRVDLIFVSGGLGPTNDDVTRDALAALLDRRIVMDADALALLRERMERAGRVMNPSRERQALVLEDAVVLSNPAGAAPGQRLTKDEKTFIVLPGPPVEFEAILDTHVMPWLTAALGGARALRERVLLTQGIGEADIMERFQAAKFPPANIVTAYCAGAGRVEVRLHPDESVSDAELNDAADQAALLLGEFVYARERVELNVLVAKKMIERDRTLATAESCTGGLIGTRLTDVPGCSRYYRGGVIAYDNDVKRDQLGVSSAMLEREGAVSEAVARAMAEGVRDRFSTTLGLAVTGIAGPDGGTAEKPVGLVYIALAGPDGTEAVRHTFLGNREMVREATCRAALLMVAST